MSSNGVRLTRVSDLIAARKNAEREGSNMVAMPNVSQRSALQLIHSTSVAGMLEEVMVADLGVDHTYQRQDLNENRIKKIIADFDPEIFGVLLVSRRRDGSMWVMDGQHRLTAMKRMGRESDLVPCLVYEGLLIEDEAKIFFAPQTTRTALKPGDRFRARLVKHDPVAMRIQEIVHEAGFHLNLRNGETVGGQLCAIAAIESFYTQYTAGEEILQQTLRIVREAWGGDTTGVTAGMLGGIGLFVARYRGEYDHVHLVASLRRMVEPHRIEADGIALKKLIGVNTVDGVGMTILRIYNYKKTTRRLPEWGEADMRRSRESSASTN